MVTRSVPICLLVLAWVPVAGSAPASESGSGARTAPQRGEFTVELNGMKLWYKVSGTGPVCLMPTPAWGPSSDLYFRTLQSLEKTVTVVYLDSRGPVRSGRARTAKDYTWAHLVADLEALRAHLQRDKIWLMGHSEGGMQVLQYACKHPERVSGLVLLNTAAVVDAVSGADTTERRERRKGQPWYDDAMKARNAKPKTDEEMAEQVKGMLPFYWSDPKKAEPFKDAFAATTVSVAAKAGVAESKRFPFDLTTQLKSVTAPALIVVGDDDFVCSPESATRLHLALPNSKYLLIEKCGHFPWLERPKTFESRVPEFLAVMGLSAK